MNKTDEIFKPVFGSSWETLPPVFKKRYANRPYCHDILTVEGKMEVSFSKFMACFMPLLRLFRVLVPYQGKNISVKVDFRSQPDSAAVVFDRTFYFPNKKPYIFKSSVYVLENLDVIECTTFGLCFKMHYVYDGNKIVMQHRGYVLRVFGLNIPLPLTLILGKGYVEEVVIDDHSYRVTLAISHPWFGTLYSYSGNFTFKETVT